jgi:hypothetical protein
MLNIAFAWPRILTFSLAQLAGMELDSAGSDSSRKASSANEADKADKQGGSDGNSPAKSGTTQPSMNLPQADARLVEGKGAYTHPVFSQAE